MASSAASAAQSVAEPTHTSRAIQLYRRFFGQLPYTTIWHPYDASLRHAREAFARAAVHAQRILIIAERDSIGSSLSRGSTATIKTVAPAALRRGQLDPATIGQGFDLCVCELDFDDLSQFAALSERLLPLLAPPATLILFYHNLELRHLDEWAPLLAKTCFPRFGSSVLLLTGSSPSAIATRRFRRALRTAQLGSWRGQLKLALVLAMCSPLARLGGYIERRRRPGANPRICTSVTVVIELDR